MSNETKQPEPALLETTAQPAPAESEFFATRKEAWKWLTAQGYKVSSGKFYGDIEATGFPVVASDGSLSRYQVQVYGQNLAAKKQRVSTPEELSRFDAQYRYEIAKAENEELKAADAKRALSADWMHRAEALSMIAKALADFKDLLPRLYYDRRLDLVDAAGGDHARASRLQEVLVEVLNQAWRDLCERGLDVEWDVDHEGHAA